MSVPNTEIADAFKMKFFKQVLVCTMLNTTYILMYHTYMYEVVGCLGGSLVQFSYCPFKLKAFLNHKIYKEND